jgi:hypothetical protein
MDFFLLFLENYVFCGFKSMNIASVLGFYTLNISVNYK